MAGSINKVILIGNLGKDPEIRSMQSGDKVASFSIATSESWKDKNTGEKQERTQWHNIVVFNQNIVKVVESYLKKGAKVFVEGQLETRKWQDNGGHDRYTTEVVLRPFRGELTMLGGTGNGGGSGVRNTDHDDYYQPTAGDHNHRQQQQQQPQRQYDELEDEIPF